MADAKSDWLERATLDWALGGASPTRPTTRYVALYTSAPNDAGGGTEVSGGSYARQTATFAAAATTSGTTTATTSATINWTNMPTATITHVAVWDASTGGNLLYYGPLSASKSLTSGDNFAMNSGNLTITEN